MKKLNIFKLFVLLLCISLSVYFIFLLYKNLSLKEKYIENNNDIDIVVTWVENTPKFQKERTEWLKKGGYSRPSEPRYTDHEEMKYLKTYEKYILKSLKMSNNQINYGLLVIERKIYDDFSNNFWRLSLKSSIFSIEEIPFSIIFFNFLFSLFIQIIEYQRIE